MKTCWKCKIEKDEIDFYKGQNQCKTCWKAKVKQCQNLNQVRYNEYKYKGRRKKKEQVDKLKEVPCTDCGGEFPVCAMHFDHLPGCTKEFGIAASLTMSDEKLYNEIDKCEVVCANCHAIRTFERGQHSFKRI